MIKVLFISPHPDDETLGCGGTIFKCKASGNKIYWLIMTNISMEDGFEPIRVKERQEEIEKVASEYGFEDIYGLEFPARKLETVPMAKLIETLGSEINKLKPDVVYIPNRNDVHSDHKITFDVVISSTKTFRCPSIKKMLMYEVISETEFAPALQNNAFIPNSYSDISAYFEKKLSVMELYKGESREHPFPRSIENLKALATFRGATAGVKYAEAFIVLKEIW